MTKSMQYWLPFNNDFSFPRLSSQKWGQTAAEPTGSANPASHFTARYRTSNEDIPEGRPAASDKVTDSNQQPPAASDKVTDTNQQPPAASDKGHWQ